MHDVQRKFIYIGNLFENTNVTVFRVKRRRGGINCSRADVGCPPRVRREKGILLINFHGHKDLARSLGARRRHVTRVSKGKGEETKIKWMEGGE